MRVFGRPAVTTYPCAEEGVAIRTRATERTNIGFLCPTLDSNQRHKRRGVGETRKAHNLEIHGSKPCVAKPLFLFCLRRAFVKMAFKGFLDMLTAAARHLSEFQSNIARFCAVRRCLNRSSSEDGLGGRAFRLIRSSVLAGFLLLFTGQIVADKRSRVVVEPGVRLC